jgi:hypothetical protein
MRRWCRTAIQAFAPVLAVSGSYGALQCRHLDKVTARVKLNGKKTATPVG